MEPASGFDALKLREPSSHSRGKFAEARGRLRADAPGRPRHSRRSAGVLPRVL